MRRFLAFLLRRLARLIGRGDPWRRFEYAVPSALFGAGSQHDFRWYFGGDSTVPVASVDELCDWLTTCEYASDTVLFHELDHWQHPRTFESLRKGDCEDHALWAWRKLVELGLPAHLMIGTWSPPGRPPVEHAWVTFTLDGEEFLLEAVRKHRPAMVLALGDVRAQYEPMFSVDHNFTRYGYSGYLRHIERLVAGGRARRTTRPNPTVVVRDEERVTK